MTGRVALVTGAGSGIGAAVAGALAAAGDRLILVGRRQAPLDALAGRIAAAGGEAVAMPADITDPDAVRRLFDDVAERLGRLDVLFNNAGTLAPGVALEDVEPADWQAIVAVNLTGAFYCTQGAFRLMKAQTPKGGRIVNNGSVSAYAPRPNSAPYTATKHAITGLTKATILDGRAHAIACGQIDIGNAKSDMTSAIESGAPQADGSVRAEPVMDVARVAETVLLMTRLPLDANIPFVTVMATGMPLYGRG
ncbi:MAG: SDR family oxidoreductase [Paracoccaceae bacterium]